MLIPAVASTTVVLAVHIAATVAGFGVVFAYPFFFFIGARIDRRAMAWFHRMEYIIGIGVIVPGLALVVGTGIYLAAKEHTWSTFYVQWGIGVSAAIAVLGAAFFSPQELKLSKLAERDIAAAGHGEVQWSAEYSRLSTRVAAVGIMTFVLILVTVYLMTVQPS